MIQDASIEKTEFNDFAIDDEIWRKSIKLSKEEFEFLKKNQNEQKILFPRKKSDLKKLLKRVDFAKKFVNRI